MEITASNRCHLPLLPTSRFLSGIGVLPHYIPESTRAMAVSFSRFSSWIWNGKGKEKAVPNGVSSNPLTEFGNGLGEPESVKLNRGVNLGSSSKKVKNQNWKSKKETARIVDWECDFVMVQGDDFADEADWSIGWLEPQGPGFHNDDSFAVLVPSYSNSCKEIVEGSNLELLAAIQNLQNEFSPENKKYMELLLSSMQSTEA